MDLKKGITYIAFGFLFTLVNFSLTFNGTSVVVTPDFVGWILLFLAYDKLGSYAQDRRFIKWISLAQALVYAVVWTAEIFYPELNVDTIKTVATLVSAIYMFFLFGILEKIAHDCAPNKEKTIRTLKIANLVLYAALFAISLIWKLISQEAAVTMFALVGIVALIVAIITAAELFKLRSTISAIKETEQVEERDESVC